MPSPPRSGPDACPGTLRVHAAADGELARVRLPGGRVGSAQLATLAAAAADLGDGHLELTVRGNLQLRALAPGAEAELSARLRAVGLLPSDTHERVRNIIASVLSGRDDQGLFDVRPLVAALDRGLCADPSLAGLPGRFLFTVDDGRGDVSGLGGDVGLYALGAERFALLLGGVDSGLRAADSGAVDLALAAARAFLDARDGQWRVTELGAARVADRLTADRATAVPVPGPWRTPLGVLPQRDGRSAVSGLVPLGRLDPDRTGRLCAANETIITPWRGVVVPDLTEPTDSYGLVTEAGSSWVGLTACAGRPGCAKSLTDVRSDAAASRRRGSGPPVHWSGCERRCGHPSDRHVAVVATPEGYEVRLDGRVRARSRDPDEVAAAIATAREDR